MNSPFRQRVWGRILLLLTNVLAACSSGCRGLQSAVDPAGPQSSRISQLWWLMFWTCSAVFVAVMIVLTHAFRRSYGRISPLIESGTERRTTRVVAGAVTATAVILFIFMIADFITGRAIFSTPSPEAMKIEVYGHQWWWEFQYDQQQPSRRITTANEIHIPIGRPVKLEMTSRDVIHSLWVPNLHGKTDLLTGQQTTTWLQADRPGTFRGQCAEYCGHQHAHMAFVVIAEPADQFNQWYENQLRPSSPPTTDELKRGQQIFLAGNCVMCHTIRGTKAGARSAPDLTHLAGRLSIAAGTLQNRRDHLAAWITDSQQFKPGNRMPATPLTPEELRALTAYLESLK